VSSGVLFNISVEFFQFSPLVRDMGAIPYI
jgi:hypothetical protein